MGTFGLIFKQMRQRALGTWLTLLSVLLGVALAIAVLLLREAGQALFGQTEFGFDVLVGTGQGSPTGLVMNTVYHIDKSPGNFPYWAYEQINNQIHDTGNFDFHRRVKLAVPMAVGDTFKGRPIIGMPPKAFVSLAPLIDRADDLIKAEAELRSPEVGTPESRSQKQEQLAGELAQLEDQIRQTDREATPILDVGRGSDQPTPGKYGVSILPKCDAAAAEMHAAAKSLAASRSGEILGHVKAVLEMLRDVRASIAAESGPLEYRPDKPMKLAQGRFYHAWKFEAVIGNEVAQRAGLSIGSKFQATHGNPPPEVTPDIHPEQWTVVGVLESTHTSADRCLYIPLITFYTIAEHGQALDTQNKVRNGQELQAEEDKTPKYHLVYGDELQPDLPHTREFVALDLPPIKWELSAVLIRSRGGVTGEEVIYFINNGGIANSGIQAVSPAQVMQVFFDTFLKSSADVLLLISLLVSVVAGVGILVSIYNSVAARTREIAILRALGATRAKVLTLICAEAGLIGLIGGFLGLLAGHAFGGIASAYLNRVIGQGFNWVAVRPDEGIYLLIVVGIALFAGLVPALKAYATPVATNLVAG